MLCRRIQTINRILSSIYSHYLIPQLRTVVIGMRHELQLMGVSRLHKPSETSFVENTPWSRERHIETGSRAVVRTEMCIWWLGLLS